MLNLKGGVGKTLTTVNMAYEMHRRGYRVLLIDNDMQGNLSKAFRRYNPDTYCGTAALLSGAWQQADELIQHTDYAGIDIIDANMSLLGASWSLTVCKGKVQTGRYKRLKETMTEYEADGTAWGKYDYCLIDNPPDIAMNVINALEITDEVIVPVKIDEWAMEGLYVLMEQIQDATAYNEGLKLAGVLITEYKKTDGEEAGREWLLRQDGIKVMGTIRYSKKVAESTFVFKPTYEYSPCSGAAQDYKKFVTEYTGKGR